MPTKMNSHCQFSLWLFLCGLVFSPALLASDGPLVSASYFHTCAIAAQNERIVCWGYNGNGRTAASDAGGFMQVSSGRAHTCGLRNDQTAECWGRNNEGQTSPPQQSYTQISAGGFHTCAVTAGNAVSCWGDNEDGQATPPQGRFTQVSAGGYHSCAVTQAGNIQCWGRNSDGQAIPPDGTFVQVSAGEFHSCGLHEDGEVECWGGDRNGQASAPDGVFQQISAGEFHSCGLRIDNTAECWGRNDSGQSNPPGGSFEQVSAGSYHGCGMRPSGAVECWGDDFDGASSPPDALFTQLSGGGTHVCGLATDKRIDCWGLNYDGQSSPPDGQFIQVTAGGTFLERGHSCGLRTDGAVLCWGDDSKGQASPPGGTFNSVDAGVSHTCGLRTDNTAECWGDNQWAQASPPNGEFLQLSAGYTHSCGVHTDGQLECWGDNSDGQASPPNGEFTQVSASRFYSCAVRINGAIECWGRNDNNQSSPPPGSFVMVRNGWRHSCGLRVDSSVSCWGNSLYGQAVPPTGTFTELGLGEYNSCGIRPDGRVECWGFDGFSFDDVPGGLTGNPANLPQVPINFIESRLLNISTNGPTQGFGMRAGFIVQGQQQRFVVMGENIRNMQNPLLSLFNLTDQSLIYENDDWQTDPSAAEVASSLRQPGNTRDAAFAITLPQGQYFAELRDATGDQTGQGIVSVTATDAAQFQQTYPINFSTRGPNPLTAGFIVTGEASRCFVIKAEGPQLGGQSISDPALVLSDFTTGEIIDANNNWAEHPSAALVDIAGLAPEVATEAALAVRLGQGQYLASLYSVYETEGGGDSIVAVTELPEDVLQEMSCDSERTPSPTPVIKSGNIEAHIIRPSVSALSFSTGQPINYEGEAITENAGNTVYQWDFGNGAQLSAGNRADAPSGIVRYGFPGTRTVRLTVSNGAQSHTKDVLITIVDRDDGRK